MANVQALLARLHALHLPTTELQPNGSFRRRQIPIFHHELQGALTPEDAFFRDLYTLIPEAGQQSVLSYLAASSGTEYSPAICTRITLASIPQTIRNRELVRDVDQNQFRSGVIEIGESVSHAEILVDMCRGFPTCRVVYVVPNVENLQTVRREVHAAGFHNTLDVSNGRPPMGFNENEDDHVEALRSIQLVFSTPTNCAVLHETAAMELEKFHFVVFSDLGRIQSLLECGLTASRDNRFRLFVIQETTSPSARNEYIQCLALMTCGPDRYRIPASGEIPAVVSSHMVCNPVPIRSLQADDTNLVNIHRRLTECSLRNSLITKVAKAIDGDETDLQEPLLRNWLANRPSESEISTVIVVRNLRQAAGIIQQLQGFQIYMPFGTSGLPETLRPQHRQSVGDNLTPSPTSKRLICPACFMDDVFAVSMPTVVINAVGGSDALALPELWFRTTIATQRLVIDFADQSNELLGMHTRRRAKQYESAKIYRLEPDRHPALVATNRPIDELLKIMSRPTNRRSTR